LSFSEWESHSAVRILGNVLGVDIIKAYQPMMIKYLMKPISASEVLPDSRRELLKLFA